MGAPDRPVLGTPPARMDRHQPAGRRGAVGHRIRADAGHSGGLAPASDARMAVMGADWAAICPGQADRRAPGPAGDPGYLVHGPDTTPSGPADNGCCPTPSLDKSGRSVADPRADTRPDDGLSSLDVGQGGQRTTDACDGLEMGAHTGDGHPTPPGGAGEMGGGGPRLHIPPHPANLTQFHFPDDRSVTPCRAHGHPIARTAAARPPGASVRGGPLT
jgi:hypothetical protein